MSEMICVSPKGRITPGCAGLYTDKQTMQWKQIVDYVHQTGAAMGAQLGHAGRKGATRVMWEGMDRPLVENAWPLVSASPIPYYSDSQIPHELDRKGMDQVIEHFVASTHRALKAGFDWLELHCAHGYLLASFLSPLTNQRTDEYGQTPQGRLKFPLEVFKAMRQVWPNSRPFSVRLSCSDWHPQGLTLEDLQTYVAAFKEAGCTLINTSTGQTVAKASPQYGRLYQVPFAERVRLENQILP